MTLTHMRGWFGGGVYEILNAQTRRVNPSESRFYRFQCIGSTCRARLPHDVRNEGLGMFLTLYVDPSSSFDLEVVDDSLQVVTGGTLSGGKFAHVILEDASSAEGTWRVLDRDQLQGAILS